MRRIVVELIREIRKDNVFDVAAGVTFWLLLSLPAALLAMLSSVSLLGEGLTSELRDASFEFVDRVFASEASTLKESIDGLFDQDRPGVLSVAIAAAIFTLSRGFAGLVRGLDSVYDIVDGRNFVHTRILSIALAVGTLLTIAASTALWSVSGDEGVPLVLRLAVAFTVLVLWSATMFHIGPHHHTPWKFDVPGALLAGFGWLALSLGFGWYVQLLGTDDGGNDVIGVAGAILLGLTWLWAATVVFLVGGELNQVIAEEAGVISESRRIRDRIPRRHRSK